MIVTMPKISVIVAVYNAADTLSVALDSIIYQDYPDCEIIVIDGGSTDGSLFVIEEYKDVISYCVSESDEGIYDAWNKGVGVSTGDWICFLGADDILRHGALKSMMDYILSEGSECRYVSAKVQLIRAGVGRVFGQQWRWSLFKKYMNVAHVGSLHHKALYEELGCYDTAYKICGDYEFLLRARDKLEAGYVDMVVADMGSEGVSNTNVLAAFKETFRAKKKHNARNFCFLIFDFYIARIKYFVRKFLQGTFF